MCLCRPLVPLFFYLSLSLSDVSSSLNNLAPSCSLAFSGVRADRIEGAESRGHEKKGSRKGTPPALVLRELYPKGIARTGVWRLFLPATRTLKAAICTGWKNCGGACSHSHQARLQCMQASHGHDCHLCARALQSNNRVSIKILARSCPYRCMFPENWKGAIRIASKASI